MKNSYSKTGIILLKITCVLWVIWGLVHVLAGIMTITADTHAAITGIADAIDPNSIPREYPEVLGAIINQHGFNLLWGGLVTIVGGIFIWRLNTAAIFISALVGGLLDIGYFIFVDLCGFNHFVPGTVMTIISATAIVLSFYAYFKERKT